MSLSPSVSLSLPWRHRYVLSLPQPAWVYLSAGLSEVVIRLPQTISCIYLYLPFCLFLLSFFFFLSSPSLSVSLLHRTSSFPPLSKRYHHRLTLDFLCACKTTGPSRDTSPVPLSSFRSCDCAQRIVTYVN